jgi:hypothetical protein
VDPKTYMPAPVFEEPTVSGKRGRHKVKL